MSSYLTFYARSKDEGSKPIPLVSYSRNNEIYQQFNDTIHPVYIGISNECQYTKLTLEQVDSVIKEIESELRKARSRLEEYTKHASGNMDMVEYIKDLSEKEIDLIDIKYQVALSISGEEQIFCFSAMIIYDDV